MLSHWTFTYEKGRSMEKNPLIAKTTPPQSAFLRSRSACPSSPQLPKRRQAFTRLELLVIAGSVFLLLILTLPALASKNRSQELVCFNNLRQIGRAFHLWAGDHDNQFPFRLRPADGGTAVTNYNYSSPAWVHYGALSNELGTAKVLACPSDNRRVATEFSFSPTKGLFHNNFRDGALSYFIGSDAAWRYPGSFLGGDRNIQWDGLGASCSAVGRPVAFLYPKSETARWTNSIHMNAGNLLSVDGHVLFCENPGFSIAFTAPQDDMGSIHYLVP
jgi:hypothetical protein